MSDFQDEGRLDTSQVEDRRGRSIGGRPAAIGGGGLALVIAVVVLLLGGNPFGGSSGGRPRRALGPQQQRRRRGCPAERHLAEVPDRRRRRDGGGLPRRGLRELDQQVLGDGVRAVPAGQDGVLQRQPRHGCGTATSEVGPFYCPADKQVYIDLGFFDELRDQVRRPGRAVRGGVRPRPRVRPPRAGPARRARQGRTATAGRRARPSARSCRPTATPASGRARRSGRAHAEVSDADIADALDAAAAVGDDRIQKSTQGQVNPETWTHGSAAQRVKWLKRGYTTKDPSQCDTFSGSI